MPWGWIGVDEELKIGSTNLDMDKEINLNWLAIKDQLKSWFEFNFVLIQFN